MAAAAALSRKAARFSRTIASPSWVLRSGASGSIIFQSCDLTSLTSLRTARILRRFATSSTMTGLVMPKAQGLVMPKAHLFGFLVWYRACRDATSRL
jgi:hypothetical protein